MPPLLAGGDNAAAYLIDDSLTTSKWLDQLFGPLLVTAITSLVWFALDRLTRRHRPRFNAGSLEVATTFSARSLRFPNCSSRRRG